MSCRGCVSHLATVPVSNPVRFYIVHYGSYFLFFTSVFFNTGSK